jgi:hypothetical protein
MMDGGGNDAITLCHVIFQPREDHMTPRAVFFRFLLLSAAAWCPAHSTVCNTNPRVQLRLHIWNGWKGWEGGVQAYSAEAPRRTTL